MTIQEAYALLPPSAVWSCSFGNPGEERYTEYWRDGCRRFAIEKELGEWFFNEVQP